MNKLLLSCEAQDIEMLMGPGKRREGWRPDRLKPSADGNPNDAGRAFVDAPGHTEPRLNAVYRLSATETKDRAIERLRHMQHNGRPQIDKATWQAADAYARRRWNASLDELLTTDDPAARQRDAAAGSVQEPTRVPRVLADLHAVLDDAGVEAMHTRDILPALVDRDARYAGWAGADLAEAVKPHGLTSGQATQRQRRRQRQRLPLADIETAISRETGPDTPLPACLPGVYRLYRGRPPVEVSVEAVDPH